MIRTPRPPAGRPGPVAMAVAVTMLALGACSSNSKTSSVTTSPGATTTAAASAGAATTLPAAANVLTIKNRAFSALTVKAGDPISIVNQDTVAHTVTADDGSFKVEVAGGKTASLVIPKAGTYAIHCDIHPSMKGTIVVD